MLESISQAPNTIIDLFYKLIKFESHFFIFCLIYLSTLMVNFILLNLLELY